jgi:hypothetical protein
MVHLKRVSTNLGRSVHPRGMVDGLTQWLHQEVDLPLETLAEV